MKIFDSTLKSFKNKGLLKIALTHRSYLNENPNFVHSNERLEFLGDAVLELIVSDDLFNKFPSKEEGFLTALRSNLVNTQNLASVAKKNDLGSLIYMSKGEADGGGRQNQSLLADSLEALIGAIYLDSGMESVKHFITKSILVDLDNKIKLPLKDPKSYLQEIVQAKGLPAPKYEVIKEEGPDHQKEFIMTVRINGKAYAKGSGKSKSEATQNAASEALKTFI